MSGFLLNSYKFTTPGGLAVFDDFNDNSIGAQWTVTNSGTDLTAAETGGVLNISSDAAWSGSTNTLQLISVPNFDFTNKILEVDIVAAGLGGSTGNLGGTKVQINSTVNTGNYVTIFIDTNGIYFVRFNNNTADAFTNIPWTTSYEKIRFEHRSSDNKWLFYTYTSDVWTLRKTSVAANWNPTSMEIRLICYIYGSNAQSKTSTFDNVKTTASF